MHFPISTDSNQPQIIVAGTTATGQQSYNPDSTGNIFFGQGTIIPDILAAKINSVSEKTIYARERTTCFPCQ